MVKDDGMTEKICALDAVGCKFCVSSEDGQILHEKIKEALIGGRKVSVSFGTWSTSAQHSWIQL